jgi:gliding motility-associated-like protein
LKNLATVSSLTWDPKSDNNISVVRTVVRRGPLARITGTPSLTVGTCSVQGLVLDAGNSLGSGLTYKWTPTIYLDNASAAKPVFHPGKTTRYHLTITDSNGQQDTVSVLVRVPEAPKAVTDRNVFVDVPNKTIILNGSKSTGAGLGFLWLSKEGIILSGETTATAQVSGLGMYYLQVTDSLGCISKDSVNVGLYIQAENDTTETNVNESVVINVVRNDKPANAINPSSISIVTPPLHGIATVSADSLILYLPEDSYIGQDEFVYAICDYFKNCDNAKVLVIINDVSFFIPEAFSPNGDGINDKFEMKGLEKYKTVEIEIFNRWGNVVYQSKNYGEGVGKSGYWDGTAQFGIRVGSGPVPTGTYYYIMKLNGKENINGSIYLDR